MAQTERLDWVGWAVPPFLARRCEGIGLRKGRSPLLRGVDDVRQGVEKGWQVHLLKICETKACTIPEEILPHGKSIFNSSN